MAEAELEEGVGDRLIEEAILGGKEGEDRRETGDSGFVSDDEEAKHSG